MPALLLCNPETVEGVTRYELDTVGTTLNKTGMPICMDKAVIPEITDLR